MIQTNALFPQHVNHKFDQVHAETVTDVLKEAGVVASESEVRVSVESWEEDKWMGGQQDVRAPTCISQTVDDFRSVGGREGHAFNAPSAA